MSKLIRKGKDWVTVDSKGKELSRSRVRPQEESSDTKESKGTATKRKPRSKRSAKPESGE